MRILASFLVLSMLLVSQVRADTKTTISVLGDSLTTGVGIAPGDTFPVQLQQRLTANGYPANVINDGVAGNTTSDGLDRINSVLQQHPDMVVIELGTNDLTKKIPTADIKRNLSEIIDRFKRLKITVLLTGNKAPVFTDEQYAKEYNAIFPDLAREYNTLFYPNFLERADGLMGMVQADGVHPTRDGYSVIVDDIAPIIEYDLFKKR